MSDVILVLNAGSSSFKFSAFEAQLPPTPDSLICDGEFEGIGHHVHFTAKTHSGESLTDRYLTEAINHEDTLAVLLSWIECEFPVNRLAAAGHRVVHGGSRYINSVQIDSSVVTELSRLIPWRRFTSRTILRPSPRSPSFIQI